MSVKININQRKVAQKAETAWESGLPALSAEILADCNELCKEDTGTLIQSSLIHSQLDKGLLIWQTPSARRQYWAIRTAHKDRNPWAVWKWAEAAKTLWDARWTRLANKLLRINL